MPNRSILERAPANRLEEILSARSGRRVWLRVGTLLGSPGERPLREAHLVYSDKTILHVGGPGAPPPAQVLRPGQDQPDLELPGYTVLPGLIEAHAHLFLEGGELAVDKRAAYLKQSPEKLLALAVPRLEKLVRLGIAGVRDAGDKDGVGLALSRLCRSEHRPLMPHLDSPGAAIHRRGRYGSFMAEPLENYPSPEACVEARVQAGADRIKLIPTGIINFQKGQVTAEPQLTAREVGQLVGAAKARGRQTFAHASGDTGIECALEGGVDSIEHGFFVRADQLARMRDRQTAWAPTFAPVQEQVDHADRMGWRPEVVSRLRKILDQHVVSLIQAAELGVPILAGSDAGSYGVAHGHGYLAELELLEQAGLPSLAVINAATVTASRRLAFREKFGVLAPGYLNRFILTRHSPLESVANLRKPRHIVFDGAVFGSDEHADAAGL
jgi:imidazolonepropionase-like amidohydrolase